MNFPKPYLILLSITGILFLVLYFILSVTSRFSADDYSLLTFTREVGVIDAVIKRYNDFCARWSADTLAFSLIGFYQYKNFLPVFHIVTLISLVLSLFLLINKTFEFLLFKKNHILRRSSFRPILFLYTLLFTTCFFFASYTITEVWFWYVSAWTYLWSIIAGNFLLWILLADKFSLLHFAFIIILTAFIAGAAESYSMLYIFFLAFLLLLKQKTLNSSASIIVNSISIRWLVVTLIFLSSFYMITILAPGTWARKEILTHATFIQHVVMVMKAYGIVMLKQTPHLIPYLILFGLPWMILGQEISLKEKVEAKKLFHPFIKSIFITGILILILILPASWILYDLPPARALSQVSLLLSGYASFVFFYIGYKIQLPNKLSHVVISVALILSVLVLSFHIL